MQQNNNNLPIPVAQKRLLNPVERISEILFGLIMALTFTCTISVINVERTEIRDMLIGALGCNIAWGLVDAVMFLMMTLTEKGFSQTIFNFVRKTNDINKAHQFIADALPPVIASVMKPDELEAMRKKLLEVSLSRGEHKLQFKDFKMAFAIFILVFLSTFPIAIPFIIIENVHTALRTSNGIAILMMFYCGWNLGKYSGRNRFLMGTIMSIMGIALVLITIALGG